MQETRLNRLVDLAGDRLNQLFSNPWRRVAFISLSFLFGYFLGTAIPTTTGQWANLDVIVAGVTLLFVEAINGLVYRYRRQRQPGQPARPSLLIDGANALRIGLTYGLFVEAFIIGS